MTILTKQHMPIKIISEKIQVFAHVHLSVISSQAVKLQVAFLLSATLALVLKYAAELNLLALLHETHYALSFLLAGKL